MIQGDQIPFYELLTADELDLIGRKSNVVSYNKRDVIFKQDTRTSHIMIVKSGLIKVYKEGRNMKNIILRIEKPGNYLGLMSIFGKDIHQYSSAAIEPSEIIFIDIDAFHEILMGNGAYAIKLIESISNQGLFVFDKLMGQTLKQLPGRIAEMILYFSEVVYESESFVFPLTRRELAEIAGTTKESLIRTLTEFKHDKIIDLDGSKVEIRSLKIIKTLNDLG